MIRFRMAKINVGQFAILADKNPSEGLSYTISIGFNGALEAKRIACDLTVEFMHTDRPILKLSMSCEFDIHREDWVSRLNGNVLTMSKEDLGFLANQTVGTARGIMFCKTEDTDFRNFILPPINLTKIIDEDLVVNFSDNKPS